MEPEAKQDEHQQETAEGQPEAPTSEHVGGRERSHSRQEKEDPPQPRLRRWENVGSGLQILFNFLVMLFTGGLFYLTYGQLEVARKATEATEKAADAAVIAARVAEGQLEEMRNSSSDTKAVADAAKAQAANIEKLAVAAQEQMVVARDLAGATKSAATTADQTLMLTHRPWVMVTHQMVTYQMAKPLRTEVALSFAKDDTGDVSASLILDEGLENIGHSVAVDVVSWSEVIPAENTRRDPFGYQSALARRKRRCDELRHPKATTPPGSVLFPQHKYPPVGKLLVTKDGTVRRAISLADHLWKGRIGSPSEGSVDLIVVGCISYRASFEAPTVPRHQTRFMYLVGHPKIGRVGATLKPFVPVPNDVDLVLIPEQTAAD